MSASFEKAKMRMGRELAKEIVEETYRHRRIPMQNIKAFESAEIQRVKGARDEWPNEADVPTEQDFQAEQAKNPQKEHGMRHDAAGKALLEILSKSTREATETLDLLRPPSPQTATVEKGEDATDTMDGLFQSLRHAAERLEFATRELHHYVTSDDDSPPPPPSCHQRAITRA